MKDTGPTARPDSLALASIAELERALAAPSPLPLVVFKHSTRCEVSAAAAQEFLRFVREAVPDRARAAVILVVENRDVSRALAERLGVAHESPQALVVRDGRAVWHASHWEVTAERLREGLLASA